ncbi:MAG: hypothetical protein ACRDNF_22485, partial [Streptosporangiaceae bacterium]
VLVRDEPTGRTVMTAPVPLVSEEETPAAPDRTRTPIGQRLGAWLPTWALIATRHLELRKRRGLMTAVAVLILAPPVLILGLRLLFHLIDSTKYGPAGSPSIFGGLSNLMAELGFIIAATLGAAAGTTDLSEGMFRHLVITGRSRLALYLARIPAGLAIILPVVAAAFTMLCLVTSYEGASQPTTVGVNGTAIPANESQAGLETWLRQHPQAGAQAFNPQQLIGPKGPAPASAQAFQAKIGRDIGTFYAEYTSEQTVGGNPAINEMFKIGLWLELEIGVGFLAGLGLGSLTGQRTLTTILLVALEIIVTPILAAHVIPYFLDGQRLVVGIAMDQLRPAALGAGNLAGGGPGPNGPGHILFGGRGALSIPPMPTWAMICVIVGWAVGWSGIGAWRMVTRDA